MDLFDGGFRQNLQELATNTSYTNDQDGKGWKVSCLGVDDSVNFATYHLDNKLLEVLKLICLKYWSHIIPKK